MFTRQHLKFKDGMIPLMAIQLRSTIDESRIKYSLFQIVTIPPEFPIEGLKHHSTSSTCHNDFKTFWLHSSIFDSWMKVNLGLCVRISLRKVLLFILALRPLMLQDKMFIDMICWLWEKVGGTYWRQIFQAWYCSLRILLILPLRSASDPSKDNPSTFAISSTSSTLMDQDLESELFSWRAWALAEAASFNFLFFSIFFMRFLSWAIFVSGGTLCSKPGDNRGPELEEEPNDREESEGWLLFWFFKSGPNLFEVWICG